MRKQKVSALVALLLAGTMLFTACGSNKAEEKQSTGTDKVQEESSVKEDSAESSEEVATENYDPFGKYEEGVTLTVAKELRSGLKFNTADEKTKSLEENIWAAAYEEELGITLDYIWTAASDAYTSKWNASLATGDIPDIAIVGSGLYQQLKEAGLCMDMTDYFENYASDAYKAAVEADGGVAKGYITEGGRMYGLPHVGSQPDDVSLLYIRQDWLEELNLPVPTTLEELYETAKAFVENNMGGENTIGLALGKSLTYGYCEATGIFNGFGAYPGIWVEQEDGSLGYGTIQPEMKEGLLFLQKMYAEGLLRADFATLDNGSASGVDVCNGTAGILYGRYTAPLRMVAASYANDPDTRWICLEGISEDGTPIIGQGTAEPTCYIFVSKDCEHPEAVVKMLNLQLVSQYVEGDYDSIGSGDDRITTSEYRFAYAFYKPWKNVELYKLYSSPLESGDYSQIYEAFGTGELGESWVDWIEMIKETILAGNFEDERVSGDLYCTAMLSYGDESAFGRISNMLDEDRIITSSFRGVYSEFANQNLGNMNEVLWGEYLKIIMGADIDNFDKAVEVWKQTGGDQITQEVNDWYALQ